MTKETKQKLKKCYERILDEADEIDIIFDGSIFKDTIYEMVEMQAKEFKIKLD